MTVYVDPLLPVYAPTAPACFRDAGAACHLFADTPQELHGFAARLGLDKAWFQDRNRRKQRVTPHYDLTPGMRARAVGLGAMEIEYKEVVEIIRKYRAAKDDDEPIPDEKRAGKKRK